MRRRRRRAWPTGGALLPRRARHTRNTAAIRRYHVAVPRLRRSRRRAGRTLAFARAIATRVAPLRWCASLHDVTAQPQHARRRSDQNSVFLNGAAGAAGGGAAGLGGAAAAGGGRFLPAYAASSSALKLAASARLAASSAFSASCSACAAAARQHARAQGRRGAVFHLVLPLVAQQAQRKGEDHQAAAEERPLIGALHPRRPLQHKRRRRLRPRSGQRRLHGAHKRAQHSRLATLCTRGRRTAPERARAALPDFRRYSAVGRVRKSARRS